MPLRVQAVLSRQHNKGSRFPVSKRRLKTDGVPDAVVVRVGAFPHLRLRAMVGPAARFDASRARAGAVPAVGPAAALAAIGASDPSGMAQSVSISVTLPSATWKSEGNLLVLL